MLKSCATRAAFPAVKAPGCAGNLPVPTTLRHTRLQQARPLRRQSALKSLGSDAAQGWLDLAKLVSGGGGFKSAYKDLAYQIGKDIYIDVNGWHLFLRDVTAGPDLKLHEALAQQLGTELSSKGARDVDLEGLLKKVPIKLGGGKAKVSLFEVVPSFGIDDLNSILQQFERDQ